MGILINITDFEFGDYRFQINNNANDRLEDYYNEQIDMLEKLWLKTIMGEQLADEFIADPNEARWNLIKEPFTYHSRQCKGLKHCLIALVYSELIKSGGVYSSQSVQKVKAEVFQGVNIQANYARAYNDGVEQAEMIRRRLHLYRHEHFESYKYYRITPLLKTLPL